MKPERRGSWYLLTGVVLGVALGLFYSWAVSPVKYVDAPPYALRADFKDEYRALIASAFMYSHDLLRAQERLALLRDENMAETLTMQAQRALAEGRPENEVRALSFLAVELNQGATPAISTTQTAEGSVWLPAVGVNTGSTGNQSNTSPAGTVIPYQAQKPAMTTADASSLETSSTPAWGGAYILLDKQLVCNSDPSKPLIQVVAQDAAGQPLAGKEVVVSWEAGQDHFFTGLKPELGEGYGDFGLTPGVVYTVRLAEGGQTVNDLSAGKCTASDGSQYWGSWLLTFVEP